MASAAAPVVEPGSARSWPSAASGGSSPIPALGISLRSRDSAAPRPGGRPRTAGFASAALALSARLASAAARTQARAARHQVEVVSALVLEVVGAGGIAGLVARLAHAPDRDPGADRCDQRQRDQQDRGAAVVGRRGGLIGRQALAGAGPGDQRPWPFRHRSHRRRSSARHRGPARRRPRRPSHRPPRHRRRSFRSLRVSRPRRIPRSPRRPHPSRRRRSPSRRRRSRPHRRSRPRSREGCRARTRRPRPAPRRRRASAQRRLRRSPPNRRLQARF